MRFAAEHPDEDYPESDTVRAFLAGLDPLPTQGQINRMAIALGWPERDPHPYLIAERLDRAL